MYYIFIILEMIHNLDAKGAGRIYVIFLGKKVRIMGREIRYIEMIESLVLKKKLFTLVWEELTSKHLYTEKQNDLKILH